MLISYYNCFDIIEVLVPVRVQYKVHYEIYAWLEPVSLMFEQLSFDLYARFALGPVFFFKSFISSMHQLNF